MNYCYGDFEFTCGPEISRGKQELLAVGLVFCDEQFNLLDTYYSTVRPVRNPVLTDFCKKLTHLTQEEIDNAPYSNEVCQEMLRRMAQWNTTQIYVWGDFDRAGFLGDMRLHKRRSLDYESVERCADAIRNIQKATVKKLGIRMTPGIGTLVEAMSIAPEGELHNALTDAKALYAICRFIEQPPAELPQSYSTWLAQVREREEQERLKKLEMIRLTHARFENLPAELRKLAAPYADSPEFYRYEKICVSLHKRMHRAIARCGDTRRYGLILPEKDLGYHVHICPEETLRGRSLGVLFFGRGKETAMISYQLRLALEEEHNKERKRSAQ